MSPPTKPTTSTATASPEIEHFTALARAKYAANPPPLPKIPIPPPSPQSQEDKDFDERLEIACAKSQALLMQAQKQLVAPIRAPDDLTGPELLERAYDDLWDEGYAAVDALTDRMGEANQVLFEEVIGLIDELEVEDGDDGETRLPNDVDVEIAALLAEAMAEDIKEGVVPENVKQWVRGSKKRTRELQLREEAAEKPVMVVKPKGVPSVEVQKKEGVASIFTRLESRRRHERKDKKKRRSIDNSPEENDRGGRQREKGRRDSVTGRKQDQEKGNEMKAEEKEIFTHKPAWFQLAKWDFIVTW